MNIVWKILSNGYVPIIPILVWNFLLASRLPAAYGPKLFDNNIPVLIIVGESIFRGVIFAMPLFFRLNIGSIPGKAGLILFSLGVGLYFSSWLALIYLPDSSWSTHVFGFAAPAYTPVIWLTGLSLMVDSYYFRLAYSKWHFIIPSILFSIFHIAHSVYVYGKNYD